MNAHPWDQCRCAPFGIDDGFIRRDIERQVLLMHSAEGAQRRPKRRTGPFKGVAVHFASAIPVIIPRPLAHAVAHGGMTRMAAAIALPRIGREPRAARMQVLRDQGRAGTRVGMVTAPQALVPRLRQDHALASRIVRSAMGRTFFPGVLVEFIGLTGGGDHRLGGCGRVHVDLDALPYRMEPLA
jgi:hypothetical protein